MAGLTQIKLPDGTVVTIDEWLHYPAFSTFEAGAAAALQTRIFSYTVGQRVAQSGVPATGPRDATVLDTNWAAGNRVNQDEQYIIYAATYEMFALTAPPNFPNAPQDIQATGPIFTGTNLRRLQMEALVALYVGAGQSKAVFEAPWEYFGQGVGASAYGSGDALLVAGPGPATLLQLNYGTGGHISPLNNQRSWKIPVYIGPDRVAHMDFRSPAGPIAGLDQDYRSRWYLDGMKRRDVA